MAKKLSHHQRERIAWKKRRLTLAARLCHVMEQQNITQRQLAAKVGIHEVTICRIMMAGHATMPWLTTLARLSEKLKVSVDWLIDLEDTSNTPKKRVRAVVRR